MSSDGKESINDYVQHQEGEQQSAQGYANAPEDVPENHEQQQYMSSDNAAGYAENPQMTNGQPMFNPQAVYGMDMQQMYAQPQQPVMQQPIMQPQPVMQPQPMQQPIMYQQPMMQPQPMMAQQPMMPQQPAYGMQPQPIMQPQYAQPFQMPMGSPFPPQPSMMGSGSSGKKDGCDHDHNESDAMSGFNGIFEEMIGNNPNLSAISRFVSAANNDFLKGAMLGAGITLLFTSDTAKEMISGIFSGVMSNFENEEEQETTDE